MGMIVVTGIQAAGKSTIAQALAERLDRSVHVRGDAFRRMVVSGREEMGASEPSAEAVRQLELRYQLAAGVADDYADAGFDVVLQDIVLGPYLTQMVATIRTRPLAVVVLAPDREAVRRRDAERQAARGKVAYRAGEDSIADLDGYLREQTPRIGLWLDTSAQTLEQTVDEILDRVWDEGLVG